MRWLKLGAAERSFRYVRKVVVSLVLAAVAATLGMIAWPPERVESPVLKPLHTLEGLGYDALLGSQGQRLDRVDPRIVVLGIDEDDLVTLGKEMHATWPFPRSVHAKVIENLKKDGATVIAYDVLFVESSPIPGADQQLDRAMAKAGNVVLTSRVDRGSSAMANRKTLSVPYHSDDETIDFESHSRNGFAEIPLGDDGIVRAMTPAMLVQDEWTPSFPLAVYLRLHNLEDEAIKVSPRAVTAGKLVIPRTGSTSFDPADETYIPQSRVAYPAGPAAFRSPATFSQVAMGEAKPGLFKDKIVFVGVTGYQLGKELREQYVTAYNRFKPESVARTNTTREVPGVTLQALHFNALLKNTFVYEAPAETVWMVGFAFTFLAITLVRRFSSLLGLLLVVACGLMIFALAWGCLRAGQMHVAWVVPTLGMFTSAAGVGWLETGTIKRKWAGYVSPAVLDQILKSDENLAAKQYEASVMFGDIRGFTSFSEAHSPEAVVDVLNRHLEKLTKVISEEKGTIDKFLGDGILAVFGAPISFEDSAVYAVRAAWRMRQGAMEPVRDAGGKTHVLATGFGIATGPFLGGDVGSKQLRNWTVIGDVVNLASRLQGVTGEPDVIIDAPTYELVRRHVSVESLGAVTLKGKAQPVECYKVIAWFDQPHEENPSSAQSAHTVAIG